MSIDFFEAKCQKTSNKKLFGLCDDSHPAINPAYIDEKNGTKWIAVVVNDPPLNVTFNAVDHCIPVKRADGKMAKRCDGILSYNSTVTFVELKVRGGKGNDWVEEGEDQLRSTIGYFELEEVAENFRIKKAYIANSEHPKFKVSQARRMAQFLEETGYVLRIENRIIIA